MFYFNYLVFRKGVWLNKNGILHPNKFVTIFANHFVQILTRDFATRQAIEGMPSVSLRLTRSPCMGGGVTCGDQLFTPETGYQPSMPPRGMALLNHVDSVSVNNNYSIIHCKKTLWIFASN